MINVDEDRVKRAAFMEFLYAQSGRTRSTHTGLWQEYMKAAPRLRATTGSREAGAAGSVEPHHPANGDAFVEQFSSRAR